MKQSVRITSGNAGGRTNSYRGPRQDGREDLEDGGRKAGVQRTSGIGLKTAARGGNLRTRTTVLPFAPATCREVRPCIRAQ